MAHSGGVMYFNREIWFQKRQKTHQKVAKIANFWMKNLKIPKNDKDRFKENWRQQKWIQQP